MSDRQTVIDYLKGLGEMELLELFHAAMKDRPGNWFIGVGNHNQEGEGRIAASPTGWDVKLLAPHDPADYDGPWEASAPFVREASCLTCQADLISYAKHMKCPVCGSSAYGH
ncbi:MAG: hypothetical protein CMK09_12195 [Ponticaulis sp.]|nr:hypothetical protein [Ponticaulis sp.]|tara:strand:- start:16164 stop:16499 length:336 start_codon:yes stop_codon:yes gene_type:complete